MDPFNSQYFDDFAKVFGVSSPNFINRVENFNPFANLGRERFVDLFENKFINHEIPRQKKAKPKSYPSYGELKHKQNDNPPISKIPLIALEELKPTKCVTILKLASAVKKLQQDI